VANQTAIEQAILELINRARLDPAGEAALDGIDLNEGLPAGTISAQSKQPLAMNDELLSAAIGHTQSMLANQFFDHVDPVTGTDPFQRIAAAGYDANPAGENIAVRGTSAAVTTALELQLHADLFIDSTEPGRGHRTNIEDPGFQEIGVGEANGPFTFSPGQTFNSAMLTEDFGTLNAAPTQFLTGVAFNDNVTADKFYTVGEGRNSISVAVTGGPTTTTGNTGAGGYSEQVAAGTQTITFSGGDETTAVVLTAVIAAGTNAKVDLMDQSTIRTSVSITDISGISTIIGLGTFGLTLTGGSGSQTISGSFGNDHIDGGAGDDTAVFSGAKANYTIQTVNGVTTVTDNVGRDGADTVTNTEHLKFTDQTVNLGATLHLTSNFDGHAFDDVLLQVAGSLQAVFVNMEAGVNVGFGALTSPLPGLTIIGHGDINGDGIADVVVQDPSTDLVLAAEQNGSGNGSPNWVALSSNLKGGGADFHAVGVGDINGDTHADVLIQNEGATGDGGILAITAANTFVSVAPALKGGGVDFAVVGVGDVNDDGFADIVLQDQANATGQVLVRDFHDNSFVTLATNTGGLKVAGVGDINGDGHADVILQAAGGGPIVYLDPTAGLNAFQSVISASNTGLIAKGVADVDGDGRAEVLLQSSITHEVDYFHLTSPGSGAFGAVVGSNADVFHLV
jgi:hypothetical protein